MMGYASGSTGETGNECRILVVNPLKKCPLGRPRRRWKNNIKMELLRSIIWTLSIIPMFSNNNVSRDGSSLVIR
jgi:hypothetical protein